MKLFSFKKPNMLNEAQTAQKGWNLFIEILIFIVVFYSATIIEMFPVLAAAIVMLLASPEFRAVLKGEEVDTSGLLDKLSSSDAAMLIQLFATVVMIIVVFLFCRFAQKRRLPSLGFRKKGALKEYIIGLLAGGLVFSTIVLVCVLTNAMDISYRTITAGAIGMLVLYFLGFMVQGMSEEVLCRSYFIISIARRKNQIWLAIIVSSVAFAALHLGNPGITALSLVNLTLFGILAGVYFIKRGNIWGIAAYHTMWNYVQGNVYGIKVSGLTLESSIFAATINEEMTILNGGSFGIEGGILTTIFQVVAIIILLCTKQKDYVTEETTEE
ncbi:MAG: CPBP family intramembrane metalloprotease [Lachnospiraceae bacterium]|nr:CPBP family intramembrane metalloprotease [Lachnospiraceae bacterium]MBR6696831.1 CPBP family intramembrane metalloprotease [Lachnospiraceae bacterium]